ncbi:MAG TPA: hypothetical protein VF194_08275 [Ferrovibrio sp.]|jgi:hypothetical protein|uniref:hypothetical protein n=1 Tax=Ferrovibrio sp. TaxID=1917215 RepID=UPI002ED6BC04
MRLYTADIAFESARPGANCFVVATLRNKSVRVRAARSPEAAQSLAHELQHAFDSHALPGDVAEKLSDRFQLTR